MTEVRIRSITTERLVRWTEKLIAQHATPALLLGIGHDHNSGQLVLCCTEDISDEDLRKLVRGVLHELGG